MNPLVPLPTALLTVVFTRSRSPSYPAALAVADRAERRVDAKHMGTQLHLAEFSRTPLQAGFAAALLAYLSDWRGVQVFASGRAVGRAWGAIENVERVLRCYAAAGVCDDARAHCQSVETRLFEDGALHEPILFPCRHVLRVFPRPLSRLHPASYSDQILSRAVAAGCDLCPLFAPLLFPVCRESSNPSVTDRALPAD